MADGLASNPGAGQTWRSGSWRWVAGAACGLTAVALLALVLGGAYVPRKNAARDLRAKRERIVALLAAAPIERGRVEDALDCVVRGVFRDRLSVMDVAPLRQACAAALADGTITLEEAAAIAHAASVLCQRAGGSERP